MNNQRRKALKQLIKQLNELSEKLEDLKNDAETIAEATKK